MSFKIQQSICSFYRTRDFDRETTIGMVDELHINSYPTEIARETAPSNWRSHQLNREKTTEKATE